MDIIVTVFGDCCYRVVQHFLVLHFFKVRDHKFVTSIENIQFLQAQSYPPSPSSLFLSVRMGPNWARRPHAHGRRNLGYQPPATPLPIPFSILAAYRLYLVDVSMTYHIRATHNSLQLKINVNLTEYSAVKLKQTRLTWNAKNNQSAV